MARPIFLKLACCLLFQFAAAAKTPGLPPKEVTFETADKIKIYADIYLAPKGKSAPMIMLFHQGNGDARGEYGPLVPRLLRQGWSVIAIELQSRQSASSIKVNAGPNDRL